MDVGHDAEAAIMCKFGWDSVLFAEILSISLFLHTAWHLAKPGIEEACHDADLVNGSGDELEAQHCSSLNQGLLIW